MATHNEKKEKQGWTECFKHIENRAHFFSIITGIFSIITGIAMRFIAEQTRLLNEQTVRIQERSVEIQERSAEIQERSAELQKRSVELQKRSVELQQKEDNRSETKITQEAQKNSDDKFKVLMKELTTAFDKYEKDYNKLQNLKKQSQSTKDKQKNTTWENYKPLKKEIDLTRAKLTLQASKKSLLKQLNNFGRSFYDKEINRQTLNKHSDSLPAQLCRSEDIAKIYVDSIHDINQIKEINFQNLCVVWRWDANSLSAALNKKFNTKAQSSFQDKVLSLFKG